MFKSTIVEYAGNGVHLSKWLVTFQDNFLVVKSSLASSVDSRRVINNGSEHRLFMALFVEVLAHFALHSLQRWHCTDIYGEMLGLFLLNLFSTP